MDCLNILVFISRFSKTRLFGQALNSNGNREDDGYYIKEERKFVKEFNKSHGQDWCLSCLTFYCQPYQMRCTKALAWTETVGLWADRAIFQARFIEYGNFIEFLLLK